MRIIAWTTNYWDDNRSANELRDGVCGLSAWYERVTYLFRPFHVFVACGTWSEPEFSPLPKEVAIINAGIEPGAQYDYHYRQYWSAAVTAACAYLLNRKDWDLSVMLNHNALVGAIDFDSLFREFLQRKETLLSEAWCACPAGAMLVWKRQACCDFLHSRLQGNCIKDRTGQFDEKRGSEKPMIGEYEMKLIFGSNWWNPWPQERDAASQGSRQGYGFATDLNPMRVMSWPFVSQPFPEIIQRYLAEQTSQAKPVQPDP